MHIHIECMKEGSLYPNGKGITIKDPTLNFTQTKDGCDENTMKWYLRLGHCNPQTLKLMKTKKMVNGINDFISTLPFCQSCLYGKQQRMKFLTHGGGKGQSILELIHSDVCRTMKLQLLVELNILLLLLTITLGSPQYIL